MSNLTVRVMMISNQVKQLPENDQKWVKDKVEEFKKLLSCGTMARLAFELAQLELDIELENKD